jgi:hypothetical protein
MFLSSNYLIHKVTNIGLSLYSTMFSQSSLLATSLNDVKNKVLRSVNSAHRNRLSLVTRLDSTLGKVVSGYIKQRVLSKITSFFKKIVIFCDNYDLTHYVINQPIKSRYITSRLTIIAK